MWNIILKKWNISGANVDQDWIITNIVAVKSYNLFDIVRPEK